MEKEAILYEIGYLLNSNLKEEEILVFIENLRNKITEKNGLIVSEGRTKKQTLAYPIKKENTAFFNWIKFKLTPETIKNLEEEIKKEKDILRFLITKPAKEKSSFITSKKSFRPKKVILETKQEKPLKSTEPKEQKIKEEEIDKKIEELLGE